MKLTPDEMRAMGLDEPAAIVDISTFDDAGNQRFEARALEAERLKQALLAERDKAVLVQAVLDADRCEHGNTDGHVTWAGTHWCEGAPQLRAALKALRGE